MSDDSHWLSLTSTHCRSRAPRSRNFPFPSDISGTVGDPQLAIARTASFKMQKIIRRTALARNQAQRKAIRAAKAAEREEFKDALRQRFAFNRIELDNVRAERIRRREDWLRGPLAPKRDAGLDAKTFGSLSPQAMNPPTIPKHLRRKYINIAAGDRVCIMKGRDKGKIGEVIKVDPNNETVMVKDLNMVRFHGCIRSMSTY
jgi:large subunit ribosomal protein L24